MESTGAGSGINGDTAGSFGSLFRALTGYEPMPWQTALYNRLVTGDFPPSCSLPTGLGKTSIIHIWLIALAHQPKKVPRRLVYVVNRRTVVDQATREAERLRENLNHTPELKQRLADLCAIPNDLPLAISTLRGQFADNAEWRSDPARPAIIVGTVDMIGSRLLFNGYGCGFRTRPLHAGFLGQDVLLVHDEAHLEYAFHRLLKSIQAEQKARGDWFPLRVLELTATPRSNSAGDGPFELTADDLANDLVRSRYEAKKALAFHPVNDAKDVASKVAELARKREGAVLVFLRELADVEAVARELPKDAVEKLTGTLRGLERDALAKNELFARFLPRDKRPQGVSAQEGTVYLVCTSAGEVGVDISADHLVCDVAPLDSMAQRFGRVNRFGDRDDTQIDIVHPVQFGTKNRKTGNLDKDKMDVRREKTLELLKGLKGDASPKALDGLDPADREAAFTPEPVVPPATDILFDAWAMTTIREALPGRPPVEPYLHGLSEWEPPETRVAWREEVGVIKDDLLDRHRPEDLLDDYPLKPHELLRDRTDRVLDHLEALAKRFPQYPAWVVRPDGRVVTQSLKEITEGADRKRRASDLEECTMLLPPEAGGLDRGFLSGASDAADDVADQWPDPSGRQRRVRVWDDDPDRDQKTRGMRLIRTIDTRPEADEEESAEPSGRRFWSWYELPAAGDTEGSRYNTKPVRLDVHTQDIEKNAAAIVAKLSFPEQLRQAVVIAVRCHDLGKRREYFQKAVLGNNDRAVVLAKSAGKRGRLAECWRHEFWSLLDVQDDPAFSHLPDAMQDLVLHLIAAHHGRARPHFPAGEAFDPQKPADGREDPARETPRRFARLQRQYGRWGLAYLESLLRAADYAASAHPSAFVQQKKEGRP